MLPPKSLPARAFEVVHIYRRGEFREAEVRRVTIIKLGAFDRCVGIDANDDEFRADLDAFYATRAEADAAALADMERLLP